MLIPRFEETLDEGIGLVLGYLMHNVIEIIGVEQVMWLAPFLDSKVMNDPHQE
jgi:hypothetical protein